MRAVYKVRGFYTYAQLVDGGTINDLVIAENIVEACQIVNAYYKDARIVYIEEKFNNLITREDVSLTQSKTG